jgi:hypothetical protein
MNKPSDMPNGLVSINEIMEYFPGTTKERVAELADSGYIPHYRIDCGTPLFKRGEVKRWISENLIVRVGGKSIPESISIHPRCPDPYETPPQSIQNIPALQQIPAVWCQPGVYFLCLGSEVVYVGQSVNPTVRADVHAKSSERKNFDRVYVFPCPESELKEVEAAFIKKLRPPLNGRNKKGEIITSMNNVDVDSVIDRVMLVE